MVVHRSGWVSSVDLRVVDPRGDDALALLHQAALEAQALYPEWHDPAAPPVGNGPTLPGGVYLLAYAEGAPAASGALRQLDGEPPGDGTPTAELRRLFVVRRLRRHGLARLMLAALEQHAWRVGYRRLRLETGHRQQPAMALYAACGYVRIPPFGPYRDDPTSVCFEKALSMPTEPHRAPPESPLA